MHSLIFPSISRVVVVVVAVAVEAHESEERKPVNVFLSFLENLRKIACAIAIFDLSFGDHYTFAFAEVLSVPLFSFKHVLQDLSNDFFYSALPSYETYARAIVDVLEFCIGKKSTKRKQVAILFEGN